MTHDQLRDHYDLYALGVASEPEQTEIREHLSRRCEICMLETRRARELCSLIGTTATAAAPSPKLRQRILASVGFEQRRFGWAPFLGLSTALALFAAFYFSTREHQFAIETASLRNQLRRQTIDVTRFNEAFAILSDPATLEVTFGGTATGKVYIDRSRGVLLIAANLPPAPAGKTYEMWTVVKGATPVPAGLFQSDPTGAALHLQPGPVDPATAVVTVTLEDESGALQPTSTPLITAPLQ